MKLLPCILTITLCLRLCGEAATSTPFGYVGVTIPAGSTTSPSYTALSLPLYNTAVFTGTIATVNSATQVTLNGAVWTTNQFATTSAPRLAKVTSGASVGRVFLITANTSSQLTLSLAHTPTITTLTTVLASGDTISIIPANTLGGIFGTTSPVLVSGATASTADNIYLLNGPGLGWSTFYHNGTDWRKAGALGSQNETILYPDEGLLIVHIGASAVTLRNSGLVPSTNEKTDLSGTGSTFAAQRYPVDTQLSTVGFQATTGWVSGTTVSTSDNVWAWSTSLNRWEQFYFNGTNWRKAGSIANQNTRLLPAGSAVIVIRTGTTSTSTLSQTLPYVP